MQLRPYQSTDISAMATILGLCNLTDPLECFRGQNMKSQWPIYQRSLQRMLRSLINMPGVVCFVIEGGLNDEIIDKETGKQRDANGMVVGWAIWERKGKSPEAQKWRPQTEKGTLSLLNNRIKSMFLECSTRYHSFFDSTVNKENSIKVQRMLESENCEEAKLSECWQIHGIYVLPSCQRKGLGSLALKWGISQAGAENVPILVYSSPSGVYLYEKAGFRGVLKQGFDQLFETGEKGFWIMIWDSKSQ